MKKATQCCCGEWTLAADKWNVNGIDIGKCPKCGVRRVSVVEPDEYTSLYTSGHYHGLGSNDLPHQAAGRQPHSTRFDADMEVAVKRVGKLQRVLSGNFTNPAAKQRPILIDVGCANGAFMVAARDVGFDVHGVDLAKDAAEVSVRDRVRVGDLRHVGFQRRFADVVTFNDCLEHFIDPVSALRAAKGILKRDGVLVVDIPDMGCKDALEQGKEFKHVKPHEHLWYWTSNQIRLLLEDNGFTVIHMDVPVPGKVTVYASPVCVVEDIEVIGPPGVGDTIWTLQKLPHIHAVESPCRIKYVIQSGGDAKSQGRARDFLLCNPYISAVVTRDGPLPRSVGCPDPSYPVYELFPNDFLEPTSSFFSQSGSLMPNVNTKALHMKGGMIEDWLPDLPNNWTVPYHIPESAFAQARMRLPANKRYVAVYASSSIWNDVVAVPDWFAEDWATLFVQMHQAGFTPVLIGAGQDGGYANTIAEFLIRDGHKPTDIWVNLIGRTTLPMAMAVMAMAEVTVGIANGLPMLPLYVGGKAILFWPVRGTCHGKTHWTPEFCYGWLPPHLRRNTHYRHLHFGAFTPTDVMQNIAELLKETK